MSFPSTIKDPDARLDYHRNWANWLEGDTLISSTWLCDAPEITLEDSDFESTGLTTIFASGGEIGNTYLLVNRIETGQGRVDDRTIKIKIKAQ